MRFKVKITNLQIAQKGVFGGLLNLKD